MKAKLKYKKLKPQKEFDQHDSLIRIYSVYVDRGSNQLVNAMSIDKLQVIRKFAPTFSYLYIYIYIYITLCVYTYIY